ncbi:hypothetical protein GX441_10575 [bacterium]|nr:hypothetical protein [bacterium]
MDERKMSFGARRALGIIGSINAKLIKDSGLRESDSRSLREQDRLILETVNGQRNARDVISRSGLEFETGLHSVAWLIRTGFIYSTETARLELERQTDRLSMFVELFSDSSHGQDFWQGYIDKHVTGKPIPGIVWDGLIPSIAESPPPPSEIKDYFIELFISLYDEAEKIFGAESVIAKRILLDVRPLA